MLQAYLVAIIVAMASGLGGFVYGVDLGGDRAVAKQKNIEDVARLAAEKVALSDAQAIAKITVTNKTIYQKATREIIDNPVYRDCLNTDGMQRAINFALTGRADPPPSGKLPSAGAPGGQPLRNDSPAAGGASQPVSVVPAINRPD